MKEELTSVLDEMEGRRILVLGDVVADIYLHGNISRISREAPVLVLEQQKETVVAGGAANVVNNVATLGGSVFAVGLLGNDNGGDGIKEVLRQNGAHIEGFLTDENRPTISKTRIIAGGRATVSQQIVRVDKECHEPMTEAHEKELLKYIKSVLPKMQGVVLSDYGSGTVTPKLRKAIISCARKQGIPSMVDSRYDVKSFKGISYVKQNDAELSAAVGRSLPDEEAVIEAAQELLQELSAEGVLVTRGELGMILVEKDGAVHVIPVSDKSEVYDVSGAGDTCVAAMILALAAGCSPDKAAELSNIASGIAVRKLGTATVSAEELRRVLEK
jgi:rfaE bifunctional protein kinase chain/domain